MEDIKINIEKSPIPLVWLDTSIIIKMAKLKSGERIDNLEKDRMQYLYNVIKTKTKKKKLLCPSADQSEEIEIGGRLEKECIEIQTELSLGIKIQHRQGIEDFLIAEFMKNYIDKIKEISLSYESLFYENPIRELEKALNKPFIINVHSSIPEIVNKRKKAKIDLHRELEDLRKQKVIADITFEQEREKEFKGIIEGHLKLIRKFEVKLINNTIDVWDFLGAIGILYYKRLWNDYKGQPSGFQGLTQFFLSDYFKQIPLEEIICNLYAKLMTSTTPIKSGDSMDIEQIATVLPFFDFIITDKTMKYYIESLNYHKKYNVKVLALKNFEEIESFFERL